MGSIFLIDSVCVIQDLFRNFPIIREDVLFEYVKHTYWMDKMRGEEKEVPNMNTWSQGLPTIYHMKESVKFRKMPTAGSKYMEWLGCVQHEIVVTKFSNDMSHEGCRLMLKICIYGFQLPCPPWKTSSTPPLSLKFSYTINNAYRMSPKKSPI